jgi:hypothetical protein
MKPKDILLDFINEYLIEFFRNYDFEFSESQLAFKRKLSNGFVQTIKFNGNLRNTEDLIVKYGDQYLVYCSSYKTWWTKNFPNIPLIGAGYIDTNNQSLVKMNHVIRNGTQYDFLTNTKDEIMNEIKCNFIDFGLTFFTDNESWESVSEKAGSKLTEIDAQILSNQFKRANSNINQTINAYLEHYEDESKMNASARQSFDILKSREEYLKNWL